MSHFAPTVFAVDDDPSVLKAVARLVKAAGFQVEVFASAEEFLARPLPDEPGCLVLDLHMPGLGGLELYQLLTDQDAGLPVVFVTGHGDIPTAVRAIKAGAVDFLTKPFHEQDLLAAVRLAIARGVNDRRAGAERAEVRRRAESLTPREREVMGLVVTGLLNKQVAQELGAAVKTIKVHRARVMAKMGAGSLAELVRMSEHLDPDRSPDRTLISEALSTL
jgi:FixJ family two-component response regulator